ncbi:MAG: aminotransferase class V-fold PLP-dependent enzyme [Bacteroidia bacterium]
MANLATHFAQFRDGIVGNNHIFNGPYGPKRILYADWTASGRMYAPIEKAMQEQVYAYVGNTHTESTVTGSRTTSAYHEAVHIIKAHVNACESDVFISSGSGMTGAVNKFQRILGFRLSNEYQKAVQLEGAARPIVFVTHMEHHSNQTSWIETIAEVVVIGQTEEGRVDLDDLDRLLEVYKDRWVKIAAVTACSNVTGIETPYHEIARRMHHADGLCFVDFACSGPYVKIDMHPEDEDCRLDAIYFSPHKFLGGPGTSGILIFNKALYLNTVPDCPGGGTVEWTNPWGGHRYLEDIEAREDGGTPPFLQTIRTALSVRLKEAMGMENIRVHEHHLLERFWNKLIHIPGLHILADNIQDRLPVVSFYIEDLHYNLAVKLLNDRYGIQVRGGCSCAGTYGHFLLHVGPEMSSSITESISKGDMTYKPGWVRASLHPTMTEEEVDFISHAIEEVVANHQEWKQDYEYDPFVNEFTHKNQPSMHEEVRDIFKSIKPQQEAFVLS